MRQDRSNPPWRNVIYGIYCIKCVSIIYVGETGNELYTRMQDHLSEVRHNSDYNDVAEHFNTNDHCADDSNVIGIEKEHRQNV